MYPEKSKDVNGEIQIYGSNVYKWIIEELQGISNRETIDYRTFHLLYEHKRNVYRCLGKLKYDELSENNIFNQIIKATVFGLLKHGAIKKGQKTKLKNLMLFFSGIDIIELSTVKWNMLAFDRNNKSYQMLLYVCYFLT